MNHGKLESALRDLRSVMRLPGENEIADEELVRRYADNGEEAAFAALVRRYGPMVLRVCYRVLHQSHDAEDAFQAAFLILAREAGSLRRRGAVGAWIHEVAYHAALRARQRLARQRHHEEKHRFSMTPPNSEEGILRDDVQTVLYEELHRLPEKYRLPLVLCNLLGRTHEEAARELRLERSALSKRVKRAYEMLRLRLTARGVSLSLILLASLLHAEGKAAPVSSELLLRTVRAMTASATGTAAVSASVAALTAHGSLLGWVKISHVLLVGTLLLLGGGVWLGSARQAIPEPVPTMATIAPQEAAQPRRAAPVADEYMEWRGSVLDTNGKPVAGACVAMCGERWYRPGKRNKRDEVLTRGATDEAGRFRLLVPRPDSIWSLRTAFVHLWVASPHFAPTTLRLPWRPNPPKVEVSLQPAEPIRGRLLDPGGKPAAHTQLIVSRIGTIHLEPIQGPRRNAKRLPPLWPTALSTDAEGRFSLHGLHLEQGIGLRISDDRFALRRLTLNAPRWRGQEIAVRLQPARLLEGRVLGEEGKGLPNARISIVVYDAARKPLGSALEARADADGGFRIRLPEGNSYRLESFAREGSPYVGLVHEFAWPKTALRHGINVTLPRGVLVRGVVADADSHRAVSGAQIQFRAMDDAALAPNVLTGLSNLARSGDDGTFLLVVPKAKGFLFVHEPSGDYVMEEWTGRLRGYSGPIHAHRVLALDAASGSEVRETSVLLHRGVRITGRVVGPEGEPVAEGAWLCRGRTCPNKLSEGQPQPFWNGRFTLGGCIPGRVYPVLFLDARRRLGLKAELLADTEEKPVEIRLLPCGSAKVRFVEEMGRPRAGYQPFLYVMVPSDRPEGAEDDLEPSTPEMHELDEFDPAHYRGIPRTDADGFVTLPALIPGVSYRMSHYRTAAGAWREFGASTGQIVSLPDVVLPSRKP